MELRIRQKLNGIHEPAKYVSVQNPSEKSSEAQKNKCLFTVHVLVCFSPTTVASIFKCGEIRGLFPEETMKKKEKAAVSVQQHTIKYVELYVLYVAFRLAAENTC